MNANNNLRKSQASFKILSNKNPCNKRKAKELKIDF